MARYLNNGKPPGAYVQGYPFFPQGEIADFPPDVEPSRYWVPLDDEAVECMKILKERLEEQAKKKPKEFTPRAAHEDVVTEIPSQIPDRSLVEPEGGDEKTLAQLAGKDTPRINRGPVDGEGGKLEADAFGTGGRALTEKEKPKGRAADKAV